MSTAIVLSQVTKRFADRAAVDGLEMTVESGQCFGLIGPNGAGKTTTFSMMCGFLYPDSGTLRILGADPASPGALKGKVGVLPQDAVLPPAWEVGALLTYWGRLSGLPSPQSEARAMLDRVGLPDVWNVAAGALSHGMAKRVALAQALMGAPPVLLLDEPTAGLDPKVAAQVRQTIREMKARHTLVVSSHNLQELEELCDAAAVLDRGRRVATGTMGELTSRGAEFRVELASGTVPLAELQALEGCLEARCETPTLLQVRFDPAKVKPEEMITRTASLLALRGVLMLGIWRGRTLEDRVLQLT